MKKKTTYHNAFEFGIGLGLTEVEISLIRQKKRMIEKLKAARLKKRISQAVLASMIGSKQPAIARLESGLVAEVSLDFLAKVALTLDVTLKISRAA